MQMNDFKPSSPRQPSSSGAGDDQKDGSSFGGVREGTMAMLCAPFPLDLDLVWTFWLEK